MNILKYFNKMKAKKLLKVADQLRDNKKFELAAVTYEKVVYLLEGRADIYVQLGNMQKDSGQYDKAINSYQTAHNIYINEKNKKNLHVIKDKIADIYLQLGHAFKLAGNREYAIDFYKKSHKIKPIANFEHEIKIAELTPHGISDSGLKISYPTLADLDMSDVIHNKNLVQEADLLSEQEVASNYQCLCWNRKIFSQINVNLSQEKIFCCNYCGSFMSEELVKMNISGAGKELNLAQISGSEVAKLVNAWELPIVFNQIGLVGAEISDSTSQNGKWSCKTIPALSNSLYPGLYRCSFDAIIIWSASIGINDLRKIIDQACQAIRPNGLLILGYSTSSTFSNVFQKIVDSGKANMNRIINQKKIYAQDSKSKSDHYFWFSEVALQALLNPVIREARVLPNRINIDDYNEFLAIKKNGTLSVGVMSGIGDAVWSFVIQDAVRRKYGASSMKYYINDSGDGRRKRSNNMLARFDFVSDMLTAKFQIHADTPMDDKTGHLNYMPSGALLVDAKEEFDYRLIVNTYLEHGYSYHDICDFLKIDKNFLDFNFFQKYKESENDLKAVKKATSIVGEEYAIFYYGAEVDNTVGGLNRDELWKPEDWNRLGALIYNNLGLKIIIIGAPYDLSYANKILAAKHETYYYNTIGQMDITETLAVIKRAKFMVSFPAGVGIVGPYMGIPTVIFWRPQHLSYHVMHERAGFAPDFATNWVPKSIMNKSKYYPAWYGVDTPESIYKFIEGHNWLNK